MNTLILVVILLFTIGHSHKEEGVPIVELDLTQDSGVIYLDLEVPSYMTLEHSTEYLPGALLEDLIWEEQRQDALGCMVFGEHLWCPGKI